jgi:glycosyltransferase involved in cell wall biosynthesis
MKILHVIPTLGPLAGGANVSCFELCRALAELGEDVTIFATDVDVPRDIPSGVKDLVKGGVRLRFFPIFGPRAYPVSIPLVRALLETIPRCDVVHIHSMYRFHLPATAFLCHWFNVPYVVKPHGSVDPYMYSHKRFRKRIHEWLFDGPAYRAAAAIQFTAGDEMRLAYSTGFFERNEKSGVVIPNGVVIPEGLQPGKNGTYVNEIERRRLLDQFPALVGRKIILFLGRINFKKGFELLVPAFTEVLKKHPDSMLVIAGPDNEGYGQKVRKWLSDEGVSDKSIFTGMLSGSTKAAMYAIADVFVLPSYSENFGVAIAEAMLAGCPVIISNRVNIWQEIADADAGLVINCDAGELTNAITSVLEQPPLSETLRRNGRSLVLQKFTWGKIAPQMLQLYKSLSSPHVSLSH